MAKPRIIYDNLWRKGTAMVSTPIADPQHPVSDTQIDTKSMFWKSSDETVVNQLIPMNLGAGAGTINFVAILGHNIEAGTTITLEHADNAGFAGFTPIAITLYATNIFQFFTASTEQWVRLRLFKAAGFTNIPQIGAIVCGSYFELNKTVGLNYEEGHEDFSQLEYSDSQVIFAQEKEILETRNLPFRGLDDATRADILLFFNECGVHKAFVICFDSSTVAAANTNSYWVVNTEMTPPRYQQNDCWHWQLAIREII